MKLTVNTAKFQEMLAKSSRGASNNKLVPITTFVAIELKNNVLTLITTDCTNYLYVKDSNVQGDDFYVCVETDTLVKLISKITSEDITFELFDNYLAVKANGNYKLPLQMDESTGKGIVMDNPIDSVADLKQIGNLTLSDVKTILNGLKSSVATTLEAPCYAHYYFGNKQVISTDRVVASAFDKSLFADGEIPRLVNVNMVNLLDVISDTDIKVYANDTKMKFESDNYVIFGTMPSGIEDYAIDALDNFFNQQFDNTCSVDKATLVSALDRIKLFVGKFDDGEIVLNFTANELVISSKASNGVEKISYIDKSWKELNDFTVSININNIVNRVHSFMSDSVEIQFGLDNAIKLVDTDVVTIIALISD